MGRRLDGKVALVTGGAGGIGRETAVLMAAEGARVMVSDVLGGGAKETVRVIEKEGGEAASRVCDVSRAEDVDALVEATVTTFGTLNCAFNNAGVEGQIGRTGEYEEHEWDRVMAIDLKGVWLCLRAELRVMGRRGGGAIVNTASVAGLVGSQGMPAYTAAKHGVVGLTRAAALEYARSGVRVNAVCPGVIETEMTMRMVEEHPVLEQRMLASEPIGRMGTPREIANAVLWLCSDEASFVTGQAVPVDGGFLAR
jgi:NAD(P)-dependent dehydrogenase (short-subunit alcohol dehydrogenase family)